MSDGVEHSPAMNWRETGFRLGKWEFPLEIARALSQGLITLAQAVHWKNSDVAGDYLDEKPVRIIFTRAMAEKTVE